MKIKVELSRIRKDLEKISRKIEKLTASIPRGKAGAKKISMPKLVVTRKGKKSGTQIVLDMIKKCKTGMAAGALIKKTGFDDKKIRNIIFKAQKEGKIERVGRGVYKIAN